MPNPRSVAPSHGQPPDEGAGMTEGHLRPSRAVAQRERPVLPAGGLRRTGRLAALPLRHAARTAAAATRLSRVAADQVAARTAEQLFGTLGELKGGAAKLGQAMSVFEAAMPEEVAAPYRSALRRLSFRFPEYLRGGKPADRHHPCECAHAARHAAQRHRRDDPGRCGIGRRRRRLRRALLPDEGRHRCDAR